MFFVLSISPRVYAKITNQVEQLILCVALVEPFERDIGRKLIRECPAQEALKDFLQTDAQPSDNGYVLFSIFG